MNDHWLPAKIGAVASSVCLGWVLLGIPIDRHVPIVLLVAVLVLVSGVAGICLSVRLLLQRRWIPASAGVALNLVPMAPVLFLFWILFLLMSWKH